MAKRAIIIQYLEDHPGNPGWWRFSRPVLRHVTTVPDGSSSRWRSCGSRPHFECRQAQQEWDLKYGLIR